jgi:thiol:disulfide interchange protein DsbA
MKKLLALVATLLVSFGAHANFKEGTHYTVLDIEKSSTPVVNEFFSFYCPHCNSFEPLMNELKKSLPDNARFQKSHVSFMGGNMGIPTSKAYATMVALKVEEQMVPVLFNRIHTLQQPPKNEAELKQVFTDEGIDGKKFDAAYNGFAVDSMVRRFDKNFTKSGLRGVPAIIVNNIYHIEVSSISSQQELNDLVNFLLKK